MFKSVFTKYITFISLLIVFSFVLLVITVSAMISEYSVETKTELMTRTKDNALLALDTFYRYAETDEVPPTLAGNVIAIAEVSDSLIYFVRADGTLAVTNDTSFAIGEQFCSDTVLKNIRSSASNYSLSRMDNTFDEMRYNIFGNLYDKNDEYCGTVIVSSLSVKDNSLYGPLIRTLIVGSIWILLASCITVYILFQRIIDPLKKLSDAAKAFAKGDFKKRVHVVGNDEVAEVGRAFNNMAGVLEKNEELRNSFLGSVSHDLRTPMTVILGYVDGIRDGTIPPEKQDYYLGIISSEVKRLSRLVNTLLEISRIQSGSRKLNKVNFNITEKARQILLSFEKRIDEKKLDIEFECDEDITVNADPDVIHQVLFNLTDNAVKFVNEGGKISISITNEGKNVRFRIRNTGDGIPSDELPHVFDRFYKSDRSRGLDKTGTGLGLYIAKTNICQHNGDLTIDSVQGEYTEFNLTLPL